MLSLEQVKLLESRVTNTIDYVKKVTAENIQLKEKLDFNQKRLEELEVQAKQVKENQSRIEEGILSALNRLNQFEDALDIKPRAEPKLPPENKPQPPIKAAQAKNEEKAPDTIEEFSSPPSSEEPSSLKELDIF